MTDGELKAQCQDAVKVVKSAMCKPLVDELEAVKDGAKIYAFKCREKSIDSIVSKVKRKRKEVSIGGKSLYDDIDIRLFCPGRKIDLPDLPDNEELYGPNHVTDIWGGRYVCLYQSDIPPIVNNLLARLMKFNEVDASDNPVSMKECVIYTNRPDKDPLSIVSDTLSVISESPLGQDVATIRRPPENKTSAYSSVHFIFEREVLIKLDGDLKERPHVATFEIQIRDIFEEGWGEVQHDLLYSAKDDLDGDGLNIVRDAQWDLHLNALKTFVDGCSQHASIIKKTLQGLQQRLVPSVESYNITSREADRTAIRKALLQSHHSKALREAVREAYELLEAADCESVVSGQSAAYGHAAEKLRTVIENISVDGSGKLNAREGRTVECFIETEIGNCLFAQAEALENVGDPDARADDLYRQALEVYDRVKSKYPSDPIVLWRYAKTLYRVDHNVPALEMAMQTIDNCIPHIPSDPLTGKQHWLYITAHVLRGNVFWKMGEKGDASEKHAFIRKAIEATLQGIEVWHQQNDDASRRPVNAMSAHKAASNILYYAAILVRDGQADEIYNRDFVEGYIKFVEEARLGDYQEYYRTRDNLMQAYNALDEYDLERDAAYLTFDELRKVAEFRARRPLLDDFEIAKFLVKSEVTCFNSAWAVLKNEAKIGS